MQEILNEMKSRLEHLQNQIWYDFTDPIPASEIFLSNFHGERPIRGRTELRVFGSPPGGRSLPNAPPFSKLIRRTPEGDTELSLNSPDGLRSSALATDSSALRSRGFKTLNEHVNSATAHVEALLTHYELGFRVNEAAIRDDFRRRDAAAAEMPREVVKDWQKDFLLVAAEDQTYRTVTALLSKYLQGMRSDLDFWLKRDEQTEKAGAPNIREAFDKLYDWQAKSPSREQLKKEADRLGRSDSPGPAFWRLEYALRG